MVDGAALEGDIFLNPTSRFRPEPQGPAEFLNEEDDYFALGDPDGGATLVAKVSVKLVEAGCAFQPPSGTPGPQPVSVRLVLFSGATVSGTVSVETPPSRARLLDFLNSHRDRFLCVVQPDRLVLVNRRAIAHVNELN